MKLRHAVVLTLVPLVALGACKRRPAVTPHAVPELFALFLPLAAWMVASRAGAWKDLLAATFVTVGIAVPILLAAAAVEITVAPHLLHAIAEH